MTTAQAETIAIPAPVYLDRVPENHLIPEVIVGWDHKTQADKFTSSFRLFTALFSAAGRVTYMYEAGRRCAPGGLASLNAFLTHHQGRADLHWRRMGCPAPFSRWGWAGFKQALAIRFE